ncbi:MAG: DNA gyrase inhibitor YacG [Hyphomicrobiaceae bacterium]|nr:DNA gyrase inhibitor YacG [Hyphomicrobiaceae bacterium]
MDDTPEQSDIPRRGGKCPICAKPTSDTARPFCSPRCREIDLGRWLSGSYVIAGGGTDEDGEETSESLSIDANSRNSNGSANDGRRDPTDNKA